MNYKFGIVLLFVSFFSASVSYAQCDTIADICSQYLSEDFISDGQQYRALLLNEEIAEFQMTLYGGSTYRISACSGVSEGNLIFSLLDQDRNLIFANNEYDMSAYWDFTVESTIDCIVEAKLNPSTSSSGCAVMLIGFKR